MDVSLIYVMYGMMLSGLIKNINHLLMSLMLLEGMMLSILFLIINFVGFGILDVLVVIVYLYVVVCEGVMGLSLVVGMVRGVGKDKFYYLNLL